MPEEEEESGGGLLPAAIVFPMMVASSIWKLGVISLVGTAWELIIVTYIIIDFIMDLFIRLFLGTFCKPCAWLAIWTFKLPTFPIIIFGWAFRIMIETMGLMVDGWMLFFGGSGCYLRWGHDCWFAKRFKDRSYYQIADLTIWMRNPTNFFVQDATASFSDNFHAFFAVPKYADFNTELSKKIGDARRQSMMDSCPINRDTVAAARYTADEALAFFSL